MAINMFFVWLGAAVLFMIVFHITRNWKREAPVPLAIANVPDKEEILRHRIAKLEHEIMDMDEVLNTYNSSEVWDAYWDLVAQKAEAESVYENKYGHSRKVISFTRI